MSSWRLSAPYQHSSGQAAGATLRIESECAATWSAPGEHLQ